MKKGEEVLSGRKNLLLDFLRPKHLFFIRICCVSNGPFPQCSAFCLKEIYKYQSRMGNRSLQSTSEIIVCSKQIVAEVLCCSSFSVGLFNVGVVDTSVVEPEL
jgi:hypothetical protein